MPEPVFTLNRIQKRFGGVVALRQGALSLYSGEIHGLVGENGAGKSTLINIATGLFPPDEGEILLQGQPRAFSGPIDAANAGVFVVHQEADLFPQLSIAENMLLGRGLQRNRAGLIDWPATQREAQAHVKALGESFDVRREAGGLSVARRTMAELAAAVGANPRVLFLDEPTASLTAKEIDNLFRQIRRLRDEGVAIVYVSHRLEEILDLCDRVTILRDGETVSSQPAQELSLESMVAAMIGRELGQLMTKRPVTIGEVRLEVEGFSGGAGAFENVSLSVRAGEILGLYGFVGAGRSEFAQGLFGLQPVSHGNVELDGAPAKLRTPRQAVKAGLAYLPEDRLVQAVFREHSLRTNASIAVLRGLSRLGIVRNRQESALAAQVIAEMHVRAASQEQPIGTLSGGNQQKVVFGRWQATNPRVLILDEPTRGVDVGAKAEIHHLICDLAEKGTAIVLISSELPEIIAMSDRVAVFAEGRKIAEFDPARDTQQDIAAAAVPRSADKQGPPVPPARRALARTLQFRELGLVAAIGIVTLLTSFLLWSDDPSRLGRFLNASNFLDVLTNAALPAILAQGAMLIICAGGIDISVGSMLGLVAALTAVAARSGLPPALCLAMATTLGICFSSLNAAVSLIARIHPIIVTLAGLSIYRGVMGLFMSDSEISEIPLAYRALAEGRILGIPKLCYYVVAATLAAHLVLRYTLTGRRVLALGNSESAARLIGLSKSRLTLFVFAISGGLVGLAAVLHTGYYGKVQAFTGAGLELQAIAAAVIGGTNILGGRGSAIGALLGAFLIALLYNSLILLDASAYWRDIFIGALILAAVIVDAAVQRLRREGTA